ncbi:hypothetical protein RRG08_036803 [Elysia crispata]|uniref:Polycystin cation channel PKD1/PKD2 domain-containing protein n=1 Tax=Elysia crispata TaxID=231223 RepID=A0AAE1DWG5_9GAST|nr:hypothetical protein RRG08_036803 [Elysia crispata]
MRMVLMAVKLFYMPVLSGMAFTFLSNILFCSTNENFSGFGLSYLMVNQYFIKPRAIYRELTANHPYVGPLFYFMMGMMISLFLFDVFLAFLNETYSSIHNQPIRRLWLLSFVATHPNPEQGMSVELSDHYRRKHCFSQDHMACL